MLDLWIKLSLHDLLDPEARRLKIVRHVFRLNEEKIDVHLLLPPVVEMGTLSNLPFLSRRSGGRSLCA